jgi:bifunctional non-homologous end joining protein LigD
VSERKPKRPAGSLREYARKRRFDVTPEPPATTPRRRRTRRLRFVVQKHRASHLHYDFRLEWDGVLLSWAVPKGPSLDPGSKRLAMEVEDHPLAYAGFEGIIPAEEYGGGTVMVWDRGTYDCEDADVGAARRAGEIRFTLHGEKLTGAWVLVRTRGRSSRSWLLLKRRDQAADAKDLTSEQPRSVLSNRLLAEIAFDEGGDVTRAAGGDPPAAIRALMADPRTRHRKPRRSGKVWHSNRAS